MDTLYLVMPAYNEAANIEDVVRSWYPVLQNAGSDSRMIVADTGSTDRTHEILLSLSEELPQLIILSKGLRQHGPKLIQMYRFAIDHGADYIFQTDSDGQTVPAEFEGFWKLRNAYDAILGNRTVRGDGRSRANVEKFLCFMLKLYFHVSIEDSNAPFRLMRTSLVAKYLDRMPVDYNIPNVMLTTFFAYYKENFTYQVITFRPRQGGENSVDYRSIFRYGRKAMHDFSMFRKQLNA